MSISETIRARLIEAGEPFNANDNIAKWLLPGELDLLEVEVAERMQHVLDALLIDTERDPNAKETAARVARMYVREVFEGRYIHPPRLADFPNGKSLDELYTVGPIEVRSACSHHLCPVEGQLWCGVIPDKKVIGLSKFSRLSRFYLARPQIQEEAIVQLADALEDLIKPRGLAVVLKARHTCMTWRGVRESATSMVTNVTRGMMRDLPASRAEFFASIASQEFACR